MYYKIFISERKFISQLLELAHVLFLLKIWISDCLCLAHIVEIRMNSLSVWFWDGSSSSYFLRKLIEFGASANSLDQLDCSHDVLAVFYNNIFISESNIFSPSMKAVIRTCACAISLDHLGLRLLCLAHIVEFRMNSLSVLFRDRSLSSNFSRKLIEFGDNANSLDHMNCIHGVLAVFYL